MTQQISDFISGAMAGLSFRLAGHPFDTIKVRMQMKSQKVPFYRAALEILKKEGVMLRSFYKGMLSPVLADMPSNAVMFAVYEMIFRQINPNPDKNKSHLKEWLICGGLSGLAYATCVCPAEMLKCVMQMQFEYLPKQFNSPLQCILTFIKENGIRSLFKGLVSTMIRDFPQNAAFFATFEYGRYLLQDEDGELGFLQALISGGLAGCTCCIASYPFDVIKTRLQCEITVNEKLRQFKPRFYDGGVSSCASYIYKQFGFRGFWNGFPSCVTYYVIGCSAQFTAYHYMQVLFRNNQLY